MTGVSRFITLLALILLWLPIRQSASSQTPDSSRKWFEDARNGLSSPTPSTGAPGTYQIVEIPLPDKLPRTGAGQVEVVPRDGFTILGARRWTLASLAGKTRVLAVVGISSGAEAGANTAADVRFEVAGSPTVSVAIGINVTHVRGLAVKLRTGTIRGHPGGELSVPYELVNNGNSTESVETSIHAPSGWKVNQITGSTAVVKSRGSVARRVSVFIPRNAGTGSFFMRLDVLENGVVRETVPITIETLDNFAGGVSMGPEVTIAVGRAVDAQRSGSTLTTATVRGPLFDSVRIDARVSIGEKTSGPYARGLSRVGSYRSSPSLAFSSPHGRLAFGAAGASFSDLTGLYAYGTGAALDAHGRGWHLIGLGAGSNSSVYTGRSQPMFGLRGDIDAGPVTIMSSVSHLRSGELSSRQLDAASIGASVETGYSTSIRGEIARRSFAGGAGTGWSAGISRDDSRNSARVSVTHAPGGSEAFARALNEVVATFSQRLASRLFVSGGAWRLTDVTSVFSSLRSGGWSIQPEYRVTTSTTVALETHATNASAVTAVRNPGTPDGYGGSERLVGAIVSSNIGSIYFRGAVSAGTASRNVTTTGPGSTASRTPKISWSSTAAWRRTRTVVELQQRLDEMRDLTGAVVRQSTVSLRGAHTLARSPGRGSTGDVEIQQIRGFAAHPTTVVRAGITVPITEMVSVKLYAERNPRFATSAVNAPWIYAMRVEHTSRAPMIREPATSGYVFRDLNGNLRRDEGEPGIGGIVLTRSGETAVTDGNGRYRIAGNLRAPVVLDESSLPLGWMRQAATLPDIPAGPSLSAQVHFIIPQRSLIEADKIDLSGIRVIARDAKGNEWLARMSGPRVAMFDALPPGTYSLELDVSAITEPLVPHEPLPSLKVTATDQADVTVTLDARPLKIWRPDAGSKK